MNEPHLSEQKLQAIRESLKEGDEKMERLRCFQDGVKRGVLLGLAMAGFAALVLAIAMRLRP